MLIFHYMLSKKMFREGENVDIQYTCSISLSDPRRMKMLIFQYT